MAFFRDAAVAVDFSRGRRAARVGFSFSFSFSFSSFFLARVSGVFVAELVSSSFLRRDRLAPEARLDPIISSTGGPSSLGGPAPGGSVDMVMIQVEMDWSKMRDVLTMTSHWSRWMMIIAGVDLENEKGKLS